MCSRMGNMRTSLAILNIDRGLAYRGVSCEFECLVSLRMGNMRTSLVLLNLDRGLACLGVSDVFENGEYADQSGYPQHRQKSGLP